MYPPIGIMESFVQDVKEIRTSSPKLPNSLVAFFVTAQMVFGFNFGFVKHIDTKYKLAYQCVSLFMAIVIIGASVISVLIKFVYIINGVQYIFSCAIYFCNIQYTLYDCLLELSVVNNSQMKNNIGIFVWIYTISVICFKFFINTIYNNVMRNERNNLFDIRFGPQHIPLFALEIIPVVNVLVFYYLYDKMRNLKLRIQSGATKWVEVSAKYKATADSYDRIKPTSDKLTILRLICDSPKWIITIWIQLGFQKASESWIVLGTGYAYGLLLTLEICIPAVLAEMVHAQTDEIKAIIQEQLLIESDHATVDGLVKLLRYIEGRPLLRKAWRILPLDLRLPVTLLSMCTTYLIVIIQFTHLYD